MADVHKMGADLLKNPQFMEMFRNALGGEENIKDIPEEGDPRREKWLRDIQKKIYEDSVKSMKEKLEEVQTDENGQWMYVLPEAGFCVKCTLAGGGKVFVNVCQHKRIAEPIPMDEGAETDEIQFKIPLSCGQARPDTDKSGKPCKVYDVIVNPLTVKRCSNDSDFRCFVVSLCIHWIKQKCEPTLKTEEYRNMNFKAKGVLEPQRIRLSSAPKEANAMGNEICLPKNNNAASPLTSVGGRSGNKPLIEEVTNKPLKTNDTVSFSPGEGCKTNEEKANMVEKGMVPYLVKLQAEGTYEWSRHARPMLNPYMRETVPAFYYVKVCIPTVKTVAEVEVRLTAKCVELLYVNVASGEPFLTVPLDYPIDEESAEAKFVRKTNMLKLRLTVKLPDETREPATRAERDAAEIEEEENRKLRDEREKELTEQRQRLERLRKEEENVMRERQTYVENLAAIQEGTIPPTIKEEVDKLGSEQLGLMLQRLESKTRKGDSIDEMLEKFSQSVIDSICRYIRNKLGLEQRPQANGKKKIASGSESAATVETTKATAEKVEDEARTEYNFAKKSERLFGVAFHNRYIFALD